VAGENHADEIVPCFAPEDDNPFRLGKAPGRTRRSLERSRVSARVEFERQLDRPVEVGSSREFRTGVYRQICAPVQGPRLTNALSRLAIRKLQPP